MQKNKVEPAFIENNIPVFLCLDTNYMQYAIVAAASIKAHASPEYNYDICILYTNKAEEKVLTAAAELIDDHFSIRFIDISENVRCVDEKLFISRHLTKGTYYRLLIPDVCQGYEKVISMDADMVALDDLGRLYNGTSIDGYLLGAVKDYFLQAALGLNQPKLIAERKYIEECLQIPLDDYFQAGLLLLNIRQMQEARCTETFFKVLDELDEPNYHDQDVLNRSCHGRVLFIDPSWNIRHNIIRPGGQNPLNTLNPEKRKIFYDAYNNPKVLHFPGPNKPWKDLGVPKAGLWWRYAARTSLLVDFIKNMPVKTTPVRKPEQPSIKPFQRKWLDKWWYRFLHALFPIITDATLIAFSGAFDSSYYFSSYPELLKKFRNPIWGYVRKGAREGRNPAAWFDTKEYVKEHPDLEKMKINPFVHFLYK